MKTSNVFDEIYRVIYDEGCSVVNLASQAKGLAEIVEVVVGAKGKNIFFSGMGKCSFVAGKLAATFSSLGIPSFELDCANALHGDVGKVRRGDIVFLFSKSGETDEVIQLAKFLQPIAVTVAITCNNSSLVKLCDYSFIINEQSEACHLNLAPTTSTTCMLVVGDAIGVAASSALGFSKSDFHIKHPKGKLGEVSK